MLVAGCWSDKPQSAPGKAISDTVAIQFDGATPDSARGLLLKAGAVLTQSNAVTQTWTIGHYNFRDDAQAEALEQSYRSGGHKPR